MTNPEQQTQRSHSSLANLERSVGGLVNALTKGVTNETAPYGLNSVEFELLRTCLEERECTATDLAKVLPIDASRISRMVNRLVDMDLLVRRRLRSDRRIVMLRLSDEGKELVSMLHSRIQEYEAKLTDGVSEEEINVLASVASKILANHTAMERSS